MSRALRLDAEAVAHTPTIPQMHERQFQPRDGTRGCWKASTPRHGRHGVDCCVLVVVPVVVDGGGTDVVVVRSMLVVCVVVLHPQAASTAVPPSSVAASNSRIAGVVVVMMDLLAWRQIGRIRTEPADLLLSSGCGCLSRRCDHGR